jgi:hypothetical protein
VISQFSFILCCCCCWWWWWWFFSKNKLSVCPCATRNTQVLWIFSYYNFENKVKINLTQCLSLFEIILNSTHKNYTFISAMFHIRYHNFPWRNLCISNKRKYVQIKTKFHFMFHT